MFGELWRALARYIEKTGSFRRTDKFEYPIRAIREAITNEIYQRINDIGRTTAKAELRQLAEKEVFDVKGIGKGTYYALFERTHKNNNLEELGYSLKLNQQRLPPT